MRHNPAKDTEGFVVWLTGLPGSGKTTIAIALRRELILAGYETEMLDGDEIRKEPGFDTGFERNARISHLQRVVHICKLLTKHRINVVASFVSPYRVSRSFARNRLTKFVEVYVKCPLEVCVRRDPKGLYAQAVKGAVKDLTGMGDVYEVPLDPEITVDTEVLDVRASVSQIMKELAALGFVSLRSEKKDKSSEFRHALFLVRHGTSKWNLEGRLRGRSNIGLSSVGFEQAEAISHFLKDIELEAVYSSPLKRALQTAHIIARPRGLRVRILDDLTGADVGSWEGKKLDQVLGKIGNPYTLQRYDNGETFSHLVARMGTAIETIKRGCTGNALLVSHGDPIAAAVCFMLGLDHKKMGYFYPGPASVTKVSYQSGWPRIDMFNYVPRAI